MQKYILLIIFFFSQGIMSWGQSDTLSYESIVNYYESKTNMIEFYQMLGNTDKVLKLTNERDYYLDALGDSYGKGLFFNVLSEMYNELGDYQSAKKYRRKGYCKRQKETAVNSRQMKISLFR